MIEEALRYSTKATFDNGFWKTLPPQLRNKVVKCVLKNQTDNMKYWFNDYIENVKAPQGFVTKVMV